MQVEFGKYKGIGYEAVYEKKDLPKQGEGTWYIAQGALQINVVPIKQINWNGDAFDFRMDIRFGANAAFTFIVIAVDAAADVLSSTVTTTLYTPAVAGLPVL